MTDRETESLSPEIVPTGDGSHTLYSGSFDQHYHNPRGAVGESRHVFFEKNGLLDRLDREEQKELSILEVGFGTGLNLLLLLDAYLNSGTRPAITYRSVEAYPIDVETARALNFDRYLDHPGLAEKTADIFEEVRPGRNRFEPIPGVEVDLFAGLFEDFDPGSFGADFIFHDPFSPEVNPDLWVGEVFKKLAGWSRRPDVVLSTYCAASRARGAMCWAGWCVAREQGALGKREMTVASLNPEKIAHLERINEERLARRYEEDDF